MNNDERVCPICTAPLPDVGVITTPCGHEFCYDCLMKNIMQFGKKSCPCCRAQIVEPSPGTKRIPREEFSMKLIDGIHAAGKELVEDIRETKKTPDRERSERRNVWDELVAVTLKRRGVSLNTQERHAMHRITMFAIQFGGGIADWYEKK